MDIPCRWKHFCSLFPRARSNINTPLTAPIAFLLFRTHLSVFCGNLNPSWQPVLSSQKENEGWSLLLGVLGSWEGNPWCVSWLYISHQLHDMICAMPGSSAGHRTELVHWPGLCCQGRCSCKHLPCLFFVTGLSSSQAGGFLIMETGEPLGKPRSYAVELSIS